MRVGLLIYGALDTVSGGYLYDRKLVESLEAAGDRVEIISLPWRNYLRHLLDNVSPALIRNLVGLDLDILIQDELNHPSLFVLNQMLKQRVRYPIVSLVHHLRSSEQQARFLLPIYRRIERQYLSTVDGFIFNSRTTRAVVEGIAGDGRPFVVATPAGDRLGMRIGEVEIRARAFSGGPLRLLFLGSVIPRKGLHTLLDALQALPDREWTLAIAGSMAADAKYARKMVGLVSGRGWSGRVHFLGPLPDEELKARLLESHVLVMPSQYEGFGIAYLEGMGAGLPAIGSTGGAAHEIIRDGENGYLVFPGDVPALAECLSGLMADRALLARMGAAARTAYESFPGWDASMQAVRRFLLGGVAHSR